MSIRSNKGNSIFDGGFTRRNANPLPRKQARPTAGKVLLRLFKDKTTLARLCAVLEVPYKTDRVGFPLKETFDGVIEALIHQIEARDYAVNILLARLKLEMGHSKFPLTSKDEWEMFKLFESDETYF